MTKKKIETNKSYAENLRMSETETHKKVIFVFDVHVFISPNTKP